jgi:hypothetical protein
MNAKEFYEANKTNVVNVLRPGHPEDKSGWNGVRSASEARFLAPDVQVMPLWDVFDFAERYRWYELDRVLTPEEECDPTDREKALAAAREIQGTTFASDTDQTALHMAAIILKHTKERT